MEIITYIGRLLDNPNEIWRDFRREIEFDRYLNTRYDVKFSYEYYTHPKNFIDFFAKRYIIYPFRCHNRAKQSDENAIYQIHFQFLADLALFLDSKKTIITCHDIYNFLQKNTIRNSKFAQKYALLGLKRCKYIISISEFTKNELILKLKIPYEKIIVIKNAVNTDMFKPIPEKRINSIDPLYPDYKKVLYVGSEDARKDFLTLLKAFFLVKKKYKRIKIIRVGSSLYPELIKSLDLENEIVYLKNISNKRLIEIYNLCDFFVTTSLYEGFGFPGLEAASCGTPVICSDIPIFREIYQDFPIYFPPKDYKLLAKFIIDNIENEELIDELRTKGLAIAKKYSWQKYAEQYYKLVKSIIVNQ